ncbi:MAG: MFS transporter [Bacteroidaceae bacterium]|nr:MFS transporter [Bacteroidaceae bacterium]
MKKVNPWAWVPTLYFAEGVPYVVVITLSVVMYKQMGLSNGDVAFYTGWFYLPWLIKPLWSPFVDLLRTRRWWITAMQLLVGVGLGAVAFTLPLSGWLQWSMGLFWLLAFSSATHDIAADGFYMMGLDASRQSFFVGIRSTFYRLATIAAEGGMLALIGLLTGRFSANAPASDATRRAWTTALCGVGVLFVLLSLYHRFVLPRPATDVPSKESVRPAAFLREFAGSFASFFRKDNMWAALLFMLLFRLPEAQLTKMSTLFLLDPLDKGGLALSAAQVGLVKGTIGVIGLTLGGILGGIVASRGGLKRWLWPMVWAISLPDVVYIWMSYAQPSSLPLIASCLFVEQFGYGFGFTAYMLFLLYYARGSHETAHYAIATAFMAAGMMLPGMFAGYLQEWMGYRLFFIWVTACCLVTFLVTAFLRIDPSFGKKEKAAES